VRCSLANKKVFKSQCAWAADRPMVRAVLGVDMGQPIATNGEFMALLFENV